jgi:hypothetical protein|uniref:Uncharacterized protein n=1 Tax=viral metagenome TaxID=1070528 RepID=A0A6C0HE02_9ZZZZ
MSFYQTTNASIVRFRTIPRKTVAPFERLDRVVQIQNIGAGTAAHYTGTNNNGVRSTYNNSWMLNPEQLQNGAVIIAPTSLGVNGYYTLPSPYLLQEYLGGRFAFNMLANQTTQQNTGANDFFLLNVYNLGPSDAIFVAYDNQSQKPIAAPSIPNDARLTPVLIQFNNVNSTYATVNGTQNTVSYTVY